MKKIRVIAVDDEPLALRQLEMYIAKVPFLEQVAACRSAMEARRVLDEAEVDAMFLDINMPDISGMEFVRSLPEAPRVIFTTAYSEYAVEGFRVDAVDYLLKPFSLADFLAAAERLRERCQPRQQAEGGTLSVQPGEDAVFFKVDYRTVRVRLSEIRYVESMSEYVKVWHDGAPAPLLVLIRLKAVQERLPADRFMRVHRSYLVNLSRIAEVGREGIVLDDGTNIPVGDLYRQEFKDYLSRTSLG
ncbi:MAG: response regulator transcription factor [Bacteroidales bacterium]|jgi:two-component system LytT family response regulator|nr:response regulator transcription factor [Bacteroidales bacterium]